MRLNFEKDYKLENKRLSLLPLNESHISSLFELANSSEIWTFFDEGGTSREDFDLYCQCALKKRINQEQYPFVILDKQKDQLAGMTRIYQYDPVLKNIKLGHTWLGLKFQGTGLNKAAKHCILSFLFDALELERVGFGIHQENVKSISAMEGIGAKMEGRLRSYLNKVDGRGRTDLVLYSIIKSDWEQNVKLMLERKLEQLHVGA